MAEMNFESVRFVNVDGLRIRYMRGEKRSNIPVLLTSPWPESLFAFHRIWPFLAEGAEVVAVDSPDSGGRKEDRMCFRRRAWRTSSRGFSTRWISAAFMRSVPTSVQPLY